LALDKRCIDGDRKEETEAGMNLLELYIEKGDIIQDPDTKALFWPKEEFRGETEDTPVSEETMALLQGREIVIPPGIQAQFPGEYWWKYWWNMDGAFRRPYYLLRGKPVTREQAFEVCYYTNWWQQRDRDPKTQEAFIDLPGAMTVYLAPNHWPNNYGMLQLNGNFGINGLLWPYVERGSVINELFGLVERFPFLEFAMAVMNHEEMPSAMWDDWEDPAKENEKHYTFEYPMEAKDVDYGLHVTRERIEVLEPDQAMASLQRYESLYTPEEIKRFDSDWSEKYYAETAEGQREIRAFEDWLAERGRHTGSQYWFEKRSQHTSSQKEQDDTDTAGMSYNMPNIPDGSGIFGQ